MGETIAAFDLDEYQALRRMAHSELPFAAKIAGATLVIVEARRDAEVRAASAEALLDSIKRVLDGKDMDPAEAVREIASMLG